MKRKVILLAISPKNHNHCVVGIDIETGKFIRCLNEKGKELTSKDIEYKNKSGKAQILDLVEINLLEHRPSFCHQEDWTISTEIGLKYSSAINLIHLGKYLSNDNFIFGNIKYYLDIDEAKKLKKSILLIKIQNIQSSLQEKIYIPTGEYKIKHKLNFLYNNYQYTQYAITDPKYINSTSIISCKEALAVITLANPSDAWCQENNMCYKFIATLVPLR